MMKRAQLTSLPPAREVHMQMGPYKPCFEIGAGGMASVYIAREMGSSGLRRTVALKVMHEHLARQDRFKQRFLDEARVLTHILHPHVCRVLAVGEEEGRPFMAMEYLVGEPVSRILRAVRRRQDGPDPVTRVRLFARMVADLAEGLHAAHETRDGTGELLGVVHRDVTPQNLFVLYDGTVRVLDFGVARYKDRFVHTATTGRLFGKLPYMAPEQLEGNDYDRRVDVWALGVVLWELATLSRLFKRETEVRTMDAVCSELIPKASEYADDLPPGLDEILEKALSRDVDARYATAREFSEALQNWLADTGRPVTQGDVSDFLNSFFPGSRLERLRWAEQTTPHSGVRFGAMAVQLQQAMGEVLPAPWDDPDEDSAETARRGPTRDQITTTPPPRLSREFGEPPPDLAQAELLPEGETTQVYIAARRARASRVAAWTRTTAALTLGALLGAGVLVWLQPSATLNAAGEVNFEQNVEVTGEEGAGITSREPASAAAAAQPDGPSSEDSNEPDLAQERLPAESTSALVAAEEVSETGAEPLGSTEATSKRVDVPEKSASTKAEGSSVGPRQRTSPPSSANDGRAASKKEQSAAPTSAAPTSAASTSTGPTTGDVLMVSKRPGVRVYLGQRLLGTTPVRVRLPAGVVTLQVQVSESAARIPMSTRINPGRLNMVSINVGQ